MNIIDAAGVSTKRSYCARAFPACELETEVIRGRNAPVAVVLEDSHIPQQCRVGKPGGAIAERFADLLGVCGAHRVLRS